MLSLAQALHLYYMQNEGWEGNTQVSEVPELSVQFQPRSFAHSAFSQARSQFLAPGHALPTSCRHFHLQNESELCSKGEIAGETLAREAEKVKQGACRLLLCLIQCQLLDAGFYSLEVN